MTTPEFRGDDARAVRRELNYLRTRLDELARANPARSTAIPDGNGVVRARYGIDGFYIYDETGGDLLEIGPNGFRMFDASGLLRARFGYIDAIAGYGVSIFDDAGGLRFEVNDNGYRDPWLAHPWRKVITPERESTTSATFVSLWRSRVEIITHGGVATTAAWVTDPGTTAEIRLKIGSVNTSAVALAAGASGVQQFQWLHGQPLGSGPADFELQARVTGGAGEVHLDAPMSGLEMADPLQCDADGLP